MTNTGTGKQGIATAPKRHDHAGLRGWLKQNTGMYSLTTQMILLNRMEQAAKHWFLRGGGDPEEFERLFNGEK